MKEILIIACSVLALVLIIGLIILSVAISKHKTKKMYDDVNNLLLSIAKENSNNKVTKISPKSDEYSKYEFTLETTNYFYYIKVVDNRKNSEICVNNSVKWQLRKTIMDESMNFVSGIEGLMRMDPSIVNDKPTKKLYIIYPNARSLLKYINECEMEFVHPHTDVYGSNVILFLELKNDTSLIAQ